MKGKELLAHNKANGQKIIERFMEDGTRYFKVSPFDARIMSAIKEKFKNKPISIKMSSSGWLMVKKEGNDKELEDAAKTAFGNMDVTIDDIIKQEAIMMEKVGFVVQIGEIEL